MAFASTRDERTGERELHSPHSKLSHNRSTVGRVTAPVDTGEESPDFTGHGALGNGGRGDPTDSATETNRQTGLVPDGKGEIVR